MTARSVVGEGPAAQLRTTQTLDGDVVDYVLAADLPSAPANPPTVSAFTETTMSLTLAAIGTGLDGGSPVTGYLVEIDDGLGGTAVDPGTRNFSRV